MTSVMGRTTHEPRQDQSDHENHESTAHLNLHEENEKMIPADAHALRVMSFLP
jgi:hypothetical protein